MEVWCFWEGLASYERLVLQSSFIRACWKNYIHLPHSQFIVVSPRLSTLSNLVPSGYGPSPPSPKSQFLWPQCYLRALSHADDIRTLPTSISESKQQITYVSDFVTSRGLTPSTEKYEAIISPSAPPNLSSIQAGSIDIPITNSARCLGAWWCGKLCLALPSFRCRGLDSKL